MVKELIELIRGDPDGSGFLRLVIASSGEETIDPRIVEDGIRTLRGALYGKHLKKVINRNGPENANAYLKAGLSAPMDIDHSGDATHLIAKCYTLYYHIDEEQAERALSGIKGALVYDSELGFIEKDET